jgi:hypothetical protein
LNATILSATPPSSSPAGGITHAAGDVIVVSVRCAQTAPTRRHRYQLGAIIAEATAVLRIEDRDVQRAGLGAINAGWQVVSQIDGRTSGTWRVVHVIDTVKSGLSNWSIFLAAE